MKHFPVLRNIRVLQISKIFTGFSGFWAPIIVLFQLQIIEVSLAEVMIGEAVFAVSLLLLEVPTGVVADKHGRKISLIIRGFVHLVAYISFVFSQNM